jgi:anti-sigma regulatory factor (Ser/Thr protein kinase)
MTATDTGTRTAILPGIAESVREARALVREVLGEDCPALGAAVLCTSELVTNSVLYTRSGRPGGVVAVTVETGDGTATITVTDAGARGRPAIAARPLDAGEGGLGLRIVAQLAEAWSTYQVDGGARVATWCRFRWQGCS